MSDEREIQRLKAELAALKAERVLQPESLQVEFSGIGLPKLLVVVVG